MLGVVVVAKRSKETLIIASKASAMYLSPSKPSYLIGGVVVALYCIGAPAKLLAQCEVQKLTASDAAAGDFFGTSVAIDGNVALVGAYRTHCSAGDSCGAAYVYRFDGSSWVLEQKLTASDATAYAGFGISVAVSGDWAILGAWHGGCGFEFTGSAYVFRFDGSTWVQQAELCASNAAPYDRFGESVSISGNLAVVGARARDCADGSDCGAAFVYRFNGSAWVQEQELTPSIQGANDQFGVSVSVSGEVIVVGALLLYRQNCYSCGAAYVYRRDGSTWVQQQQLTASDKTPYDQFGISVSVSGNVAVVGAQSADCPGFPGICGTAYAYKFNGTIWSEEQKLAGPGWEFAYFGSSVSVNDGLAVVGAYRDGCRANDRSGVAQVFRFDGSTWIGATKLIASDFAANDWFGRSVSASADFAFVGASHDDCDAGADCGSVYVFALGPECDMNDCNANREPDFCDILRGTWPDCQGNGVLDLCDIRDGWSDDTNDDGVPDECQIVAVPLDIRPGACPNPFNPTSRGVVPVALVGSSDFDVSQVDTDSLVLRLTDGVGGSVSPLAGPPGPGIRSEDVATPFTGDGCDCHELGADRVLDLALKFSTTEMAEALQLDSSVPGTSVRLTLTGSLLDGASFEASDCILITGRSFTPLGVHVADEPLRSSKIERYPVYTETIPTPVGRIDSKE